MPGSAPSGRDPLTESIIGAAIEVHRNLGPGLLESIYETCLHWELQRLHIEVERQVPIPMVYKSLRLPHAYRVDLIVEREVIVEVKAVDRLHSFIDAQVLTYLKMTSVHTALILNFNAPLLRDGLRRLVL